MRKTVHREACCTDLSWWPSGFFSLRSQSVCLKHGVDAIPYVCVFQDFYLSLRRSKFFDQEYLFVPYKTQDILITARIQKQSNWKTVQGVLYTYIGNDQDF